MTPLDRDLLIRTIASEAGGQGEEGMSAVAHVIKNRLATGRWGKTYGDVVFSRSQFEPWGRGGRSNDPFEMETTDGKYQQASRIVDGMLSGKLADPTQGATHFMNTATVRERNGGTLGNAAAWAKNQTAQIGAHTFYAPDGRVTAAAPAAVAKPAPPASYGATDKPLQLSAFSPNQAETAPVRRQPAESVLGALLGARGQAGEPTRTPPPSAGEDPLGGLAGIVPSASAYAPEPVAPAQQAITSAASNEGAKISVPVDATVNTPEESANSYFSRITPEQRGPNPLQQLASLFGVSA